LVVISNGKETLETECFMPAMVLVNGNRFLQF